VSVNNAPELLFLGEGPRANYVEGALSTAFRVSRVYGNQPLASTSAESRLREFSVVVLSDYPAGHLSTAHQHALVSGVEQDGQGLLMIGGWASFGGPRGSYYGSPLADLLPVTIGPGDDRVNTPLGTVLVPRREPHAAIKRVQGQPPCIVVGYNGVRAEPDADVLVNGDVLRIDAFGQPVLERSDTPLLTVWERGRGRVAALAPDMMPHWAGGILDWGTQRLTLSTGNEVGDLYVAFLVDVCRWLAHAT
jgi:uncharacterized membrane protein